MPKYDDITVKLTGTDGNIMNLTGRVTSAVRETYGAAAAAEIWDKVYDAESYDEALNILAETVNVE